MTRTCPAPSLSTPRGRLHFGAVDPFLAPARRLPRPSPAAAAAAERKALRSRPRLHHTYSSRVKYCEPCSTYDGDHTDNPGPGAPAQLWRVVRQAGRSGRHRGAVQQGRCRQRSRIVSCRCDPCTGADRLCSAASARFQQR